MRPLTTRARSRHTCGHPRCRLLGQLAALLAALAYICGIGYLATGSYGWIVAGAAAVIAQGSARAWPHPVPPVDLTALAEVADPWHALTGELSGR